MPTEITYANDAASLPALPVDATAAIGAAIDASNSAQDSAASALASKNVSQYNADAAEAAAAQAASTILTYYGPLAADPATRPSGAARVTGDMYYSTSTTKLRIFNGTAWFDAAVSALGTAATKNTGTSGNTVPLLDGANAWSQQQNFSAAKPISASSASTNSPQLEAVNSAPDASAGYLMFRKNRGSTVASANGDSLGMVRGYGYDGAAWQVGATLEFRQATGPADADLVYANAFTEKFRFTSSGVRAAAGSYYNWGATSGSTGYGLRDNAGVIEAKNSGGAWTPVLASASVSVRQTVFNGPVDTNGYPSIFPATSATLSITTQNVSAATPLGVTAAQGFTSTGKLDYTSQFTANQSWNTLTAFSSLLLYVNAQTGALGFTSLAPIYQHGGTPAVTNGQFTFNISEMKGYLGNGTTAPATPLVFVGEVVTDGTGVTSAIAYAYNGRYDSGWTATLPAAGTLTSKNSAIGVGPHRARVSLQCTTADNGYAVGDNMELAQSLGSMRTTSFWTTFTSGGGYVSLPNKSTGASALLTAASWKWRIVAERGW